MGKGVSIHVGVDYLDKNSYGISGKLPSCSRDAIAMYSLAMSAGFSPLLLCNEHATSEKLIYLLHLEARELERGDILFLSFSGHGAQLQDTNGDEPDGYDETWLLYDRMMKDDELHMCWSRFKEGVRILIVSDSCHSGTVTKSLSFDDDNFPEFDGGPADSISREMEKVYDRDHQYYDSIWKPITVRPVSLYCSVLLLAACQDEQVAYAAGEEKTYSVFTEVLLEAWNGGRFDGNYRDFYELIRVKMGHGQNPNYFFTGVSHPYFENEKPFTI